jgi:hypothetical protein
MLCAVFWVVSGRHALVQAEAEAMSEYGKTQTLAMTSVLTQLIKA